MPTINVDDSMDRWRYRCPYGHTNWEPTNSHFWCQACSRASKHDDDIYPSFDTLVDQRTDGTERQAGSIRQITSYESRFSSGCR
jgi:5-methylcytosine-specific restriction endonuclease McrA